MTKEQLRLELLAGKTLSDCFANFVFGQDCEIVKAGSFEISDEIIYIPDIDLNELRAYVDHAVQTDHAEETDEIIADILSCCYTGKDFVAEAHGDIGSAQRLFAQCDWQHPNSLAGELNDEEGAQ